MDRQLRTALRTDADDPWRHWVRAGHLEPIALAARAGDVLATRWARRLGLPHADLDDCSLRRLEGPIRQLDLRRFQLSPDALRSLHALPQLHTLRIPWSATAAHVAALRGHASLQRLELTREVGLRGLQHAADLPALRVLDPRAVPLCDDNLRVLRDTTTLEELSLPRALTPACLPHLLGLHRLRRLEVYPPFWTEAGLREAAALPRLEQLDLRGARVGEGALRHLSAWPRLRELWLPRGLRAPANLPPLRTLGLRFAHVTGAWMRRLTTLPLRTLSLCGCTLDDEALGVLGTLTTLERLDLSDTPTTNRGLRHLRGLHGLRTLDLSSTRVTGRGMSYLRDLTGLRTLRLRNTGVTNPGVARLTPLRALTQLDLAGTRVTPACARSLRGLPGLRHAQPEA